MFFSVDIISIKSVVARERTNASLTPLALIRYQRVTPSVLIRYQPVTPSAIIRFQAL